MVTLAGLQINPDVEESNGAFTVLPAGKYKAVIMSDELKSNKAATGKILVLKIQVIEGQFAQEILSDNINITNPSAQCQAIGQGTLKRICNLCKVPFPPADTAGLMGKPIVITVSVEKFTSKTSGKELDSNSIKKYEPADTPIPQVAPAQTQAQGTPPAAAGGW
jgi:hypothetical protein